MPESFGSMPHKRGKDIINEPKEVAVLEDSQPKVSIWLGSNCTTLLMQHIDNFSLV